MEQPQCSNLRPVRTRYNVNMHIWMLTRCSVRITTSNMCKFSSYITWNVSALHTSRYSHISPVIQVPAVLTHLCSNDVHSKVHLTPRASWAMSLGKDVSMFHVNAVRTSNWMCVQAYLAWIIPGFHVAISGYKICLKYAWKCLVRTDFKQNLLEFHWFRLQVRTQYLFGSLEAIPKHG